MYECCGLVALEKSNFCSVSSLFPGKRWRRNRSASSLLNKGFCIISMGHHLSRCIVYESSKSRHVPIYVMMPKDTFGIDSAGLPRISEGINYKESSDVNEPDTRCCPFVKRQPNHRLKALTISLKALKLAGVHGVAVEVWWGIVERSSPLSYNWFLYEELFKIILGMGLKLHVALAFHASISCSRVSKGCINLPLWVAKIGCLNKDVYYRDQYGCCSTDCLTLGVDHIPLFGGRTALQCYEDFMLSFKSHFASIIGSAIEEVGVGLGPSGELRYPSHPKHDGRWKFPGVGEFQCYDKYMMEDLRQSAHQVGKPAWGEKRPQYSGYYNSHPSEIPFFEDGEDNFLSDYGRFFLDWYSGKLIQHADAILAVAESVFKNNEGDPLNSVLLVAKLGSVHWWYRTAAHAAELTAGYYNTATRDGYNPLGTVLSRHKTALHISCFEMIDNEMPATFYCSPEGLLDQMRNVAKENILPLTGRNATERFDKDGLCRIITNSCYSEECIRSFTYCSLSEKIFQMENWNNFVLFVNKMSKKR